MDQRSGGNGVGLESGRDVFSPAIELGEVERVEARASGKKWGEIAAVREMMGALMPANKTDSAQLLAPLRSQGLNGGRDAGVDGERGEVGEGLAKAEGD